MGVYFLTLTTQWTNRWWKTEKNGTFGKSFGKRFVVGFLMMLKTAKKHPVYITFLLGLLLLYFSNLLYDLRGQTQP